MKNKIDIFGSDVLEHILKYSETNCFEICTKITEESIVSVASTEFADANNSFQKQFNINLSSNFQYILHDLTIPLLVNSEGKWLVLDLLNERWDLNEINFPKKKMLIPNTARFISLKKTLLDNRAIQEAQVSLVKFNSLPWEFLKSSYTRFSDIIKGKYSQEKIIIVENYLGTHVLKSNLKIEENKYPMVLETNKYLKKLYKLLFSLLPGAHIVKIPEGTLLSENHMNKGSSLNFVPSYYQYVNNALSAIINNNAKETLDQMFINQKIQNEILQNSIKGKENERKFNLVQKDVDEYRKNITQLQHQVQSLQFENAKLAIINNKATGDISKSIVKLEPDKCSGCSACYNACPINAISMGEDDRGFLIPIVDNNRCRNCGYCAHICPALNPRFLNTDKEYCLAIMADDNLRRDSASGGVFPVLAEYFINLGGYVCGAAWNDKFEVEHIIIKSRNDIWRLQGSKYVQSNINTTYRTVQKLLDEDNYLLFTGTPCQVDGLLHYLKKDYSKLYTMEIVCEGVPSQKVFQSFLQTKFPGKKITNIRLRDKRDNGWGINCTVEFADKTQEKTIMQNSLWFQGFLRFYLNRDSCYQCQYNQKRRVADFTAGDFWGIANYYPQYDDKKGTSVLTINNNKADKLYYKINDKFKLKEWLPLEYSIKHNGAWAVHMWNPPKRKRFLELIKTENYCDALEDTLYDQKVYDVGIVGWWYYYNYGSILTYFALNRALLRMGYTALMIHHTNDTVHASKLENAFPENFIKKYCAISHFYTSNDMYLLNKRCRAFISGSDQLWNPNCEADAGKEFFLDFVDDHHIKISYASSLGNSLTADPAFIEKYAPLAQRFDAVSVREEMGIEGCKAIYGVNAIRVCDPVFLCEKEEFDKLADISTTAIGNRKYLLSFILDPTEEKKQFILQKAAEMDLELITLVDLTGANEKAQQLGLPNTKPFASVEDFIKYYKNAEFVITDSFHGTCFSVIYNKPFISLANYGRGEKRVAELLNWLGIEDHILTEIRNDFTVKEINYNKVNDKIEKARNTSKKWLEKALKKSKKR